MSIVVVAIFIAASRTSYIMYKYNISLDTDRAPWLKFEAIVKVLLSEFNLSHIKISNSSYLISSMNDSRGFSLSFG